MALNVNVSKVWKSVKTVSVNVSSTWRHVPQIYINVNGVWKPIWTYTWSIGGWGSCSASCGGGTQTRAVTCTRNDGTVMADSICTKFVGAKPATSQSCNTHSCISCLYDTQNRWNMQYIAAGGGTCPYSSSAYIQVYVGGSVAATCYGEGTSCGAYTRGNERKLVDCSYIDTSGGYGGNWYGERDYEICGQF